MVPVSQLHQVNPLLVTVWFHVEVQSAQNYQQRDYQNALSKAL
jgi:hypothetical protein